MVGFDDFLTKYIALNQRSRRKFLVDFISLMDEGQLSTLVRKLGELTLPERRATSHHLSGLVTRADIRDIIRNIAGIVDEGDRKKEDSFERIQLYTKAAKTPLDTRVFLKKRMIVHVDFAGIGSEHKGNHPAIVWHVHDSSERVLVIPCTSYKRESTVESAIDINIGPARFFGPNNAIHGTLPVSTVALLDQIQPISRKRITSHKTQNPVNGQYAIARIDEQQVRRIEEGLQVLFHGKKTLYEEYILDDVSMIPEFHDHDVQYGHLFRLLQNITDHGTHIEYQVKDDSNFYVMYRRPIRSSLTPEKRRELLKKWIRPKAIRNVDKSINIPSPVIRDNAYQDLLNQIKDRKTS